ncbi:uncharacterized protein LOC116618550 [Nematostella vectensis]|uniref:uncharacterized protein LOC116618550 n=1 Tax=Nematostella vectensis TaxID=45351 RepID=UPI002076E906|nr:uncharacterized protein LOC116618550 [Nematostella vectensis]
MAEQDFKVVLLTLSAIIILQTGDSCKIVRWYPASNETWLLNHVFKNLTRRNEGACHAACLMNDSCRSYNFGHQLQLCQLSNSDHVEHPGDLVPKENFMYRGTMNACATGICPAGSLCQADFANNSYTCVCPADNPYCLARMNTSFHRCHAFNTSSDGVIQLEATHSSWRADGFCRVDFTPTSIVTGQQYNIAVDLRARHVSHDTTRGVHPGVAFNMVDGDNFDFVYFRYEVEPLDTDLEIFP